MNNTFVFYKTAGPSQAYANRYHFQMHQTLVSDTYKCYKSSLTLEKYLCVNLHYPYKQALAKFRSSPHDLMIEKGRHIGLDRKYRYCHDFCYGVRISFFM